MSVHLVSYYGKLLEQTIISGDRGAKLISSMLEDEQIRRQDVKGNFAEVWHKLYLMSRWFCIEQMQDCQNLIDSGGLSHMDASFERACMETAFREHS